MATKGLSQLLLCSLVRLFIFGSLDNVFWNTTAKNIAKTIALCHYHLFFFSSLEVFGRVEASLNVNIKDLINESICQEFREII